MTWIGSTFIITLVAYIVASGIPIFGGLVALIGALLGRLYITTDGCKVALRQLEGGANYKMVLWGHMGHICYRSRHILDDRWHLWIGCGNH